MPTASGGNQNPRIRREGLSEMFASRMCPPRLFCAAEAKMSSWITNLLRRKRARPTAPPEKPCIEMGCEGTMTFSTMASGRRMRLGLAAKTPITANDFTVSFGPAASEEVPNHGLWRDHDLQRCSLSLCGQVAMRSGRCGPPTTD